MAKLSILIPANNEMFLVRTIQDILEHIEEDTEILVGLDGYWPPEPIADHPRVKIFHVTESIGQRAMTNQLARLSKARYLIKCDAHCGFDQGFDRKMLEFFKEQGDDMVAVPIMRNLHAFNWVCPEGHTRYQGPSGVCTVCGKETIRDVVWISKTRPESTSYCFDSDPHFQYNNEYKKRPEYQEMQKKGYTESMSLQGSFFMSTRHNYWKYQLCDERAGSWGNQGIELACASWLCGLRVLCNHKTWYSHMFRTQGGDFGFPYEQRGVEKTKKYIKDKYWNKKHPLQIHGVDWLIRKFMPINCKDKKGRDTSWTEDLIKKL
jgi:hypothetical protein